MSVGQGDCTVFRTEGTTVMIDAGPNTHGFDAGSRIVVPKLRAMGVANVELLILTHPDSDHVGGVTSVLKAYPDTKIAISACFRENKEIRYDLQKWHISDDRVWWLSSVQVAMIGKFRLEIRCPQVAANGPANDGSVFVHLSHGDASAVMSGDAPVMAENQMAALSDWGSVILKAGHHGSRTSTGDRWLAAVRPKIAIISCGRDNSYGHPHRQVVDRLERANIQIMRTDVLGDIRFSARNGKFDLDQ